MKRYVDRAKELTRNLTAGVRRAVEPSLAADASPLEMRHAILEEIESRVQPVGQGRRVLEGTALRVKVVAGPDGDERALKTGLSQLPALASARLRELGCEVAPGWVLDVVVLKRRPATWSDGQRFALDEIKQSAEGANELPTITLVVIRGSASESKYVLAQRVIRIGRTESPVDERGRPRHNDVAFVDDNNAENKTVTRGHCQIRYVPAAGRYYVFDEGSANGTRVIRAGESLEVHMRDPEGVALASGDELQVGSACLRVKLPE